ncbi:twin-arginine translocation pathway signal (plasmid) [Tolypothrix tenuis PCC 7101]|uniref:Twin-arginine translocation pathway signal n=1 Tax=Tolypothrix tenuis PCC 7101 TaxID=231146 RepID=A0A1Z4NB42_9CYAN|nr:sulfatase-like hydrolase/transferase [Aulosira sp. FACHB-113]BAZ02949.1 twin-arginine translocation pathway signal [Tolypothrix tenuis PCC 7101]BAZ78128.1 twin-arginine translocation pathway signal [Aulosira laxa NIES-50]
MVDTSSATTQHPNIVFILADDLGWGDLSIDGQQNYHTPHLDNLAKEGIRFSNAYSASPVCTPTRVSFFTGRYPGRIPLGVREPLLSFKQIGDKVGLPPEHPTIASLLKANGYETALVGKWHCGYLPKYGPLKSGFDEFFGNLSGAIDYFRHVDTSGEPDLWEAEVSVKEIGYVTDLFTERAIDFIKRPHNRPFYLSLHHTAPHWPWEGPNDIELSNTLIGKDNVQNWVNTGTAESYAAVVERLDYGVGRVLQALSDASVADNTIVIFASDNGGEKFSNLGGFKGKKGNLYEGGIRVPTFIRWPGVIQPNQVSEQVIITHDITATILAATNTNPDPNYPLDGQNLLPTIKGEAPVTPRTLFWRHKGVDNPALPPKVLQGAVRSGDWKYLKSGENEYLFNLATDETEEVDLKTQQKETFEQLRARYEKWALNLEPYPTCSVGDTRRQE